MLTLSRPNYCFLLLVLLMISVAFVGLTLELNSVSLHAFERHGDEALLVMQCLSRNGAIQVWEQPNGRIARICQLDNGKFGIEISENGKNITAFIKNKMKTLEQVERYMKNRGARLVWSR